MSNVHPPTTGAGRVNHGTKPLGLNEKSKAALKNRSSEVKFKIKDELFELVSSDLWTDTDSRLT